MVVADSGSRSFTVSVCFVLVLVFRFLIFSLSGFPALFHRKSCHVSPFPPFAFCYPFLRCSSLRYRPSVFHSLFYALLFFHIIMYAHVCGCGSAASFARGGGLRAPAGASAQVSPGPGRPPHRRAGRLFSVTVFCPSSCMSAWGAFLSEALPPPLFLRPDWSYFLRPPHIFGTISLKISLFFRFTAGNLPSFNPIAASL